MMDGGMREWPTGYGRRILQSVDSTLDEARRMAPGLQGPEWILAHQQTAARGRRGRAWSMPAGNFAATLILRPDEPAQVAALRSFLASLALREALCDLTGRGTGIALKWPNDVLLNGGKVAGILLESLGAGVSLSHLAIGIGINLAAAPSVEDVEARALRPVSVLSETGISIAPEDMLLSLAAHYARLETLFTTYGFEPVRTAWMRDAARLGQVITARTGNTETTGTFVDVDKEGNLVLETAKGRVSIPAADVYF